MEEYAKGEDTKDDSKFTISDTTDLYVAVRQRDEKMAQSLIDKEFDVNGKEGKFNFTLLHSAALYGRIIMVELLLEHGATFDCCDFSSLILHGRSFLRVLKCVNHFP